MITRSAFEKRDDENFSEYELKAICRFLNLQNQGENGIANRINMLDLKYAFNDTHYIDYNEKFSKFRVYKMSNQMRKFKGL